MARSHRARPRLAAQPSHRLRLLLAPDKHVIYPENVPSALRQVGPTSRTDQVYHRSRRHWRGNGRSPAGARWRRRRRADVLPTDTHWNDRGAFIAYQQIIDAVRQQVPAVPPAWRREDFEANRAEVEGKRSRATGGADGPSRKLICNSSQNVSGEHASWSRWSGTEGAGRPPGNRNRRLPAASRRDLPRLVHVAARAVPVGTFQPRGLPVAERLRSRRGPRRSAPTSSFRRSSAGISTRSCRRPNSFRVRDHLLPP